VVTAPGLSVACPVREAGAEDAVAGVPARWVATPGSVPEAAELLRACSELGLVVVPRGGGTKLDWGMPPTSVDVVVDTSGLTGVEHEAGDLVAVVGAGTPRAALQELLGAAGQELALDQPIPGPAAERSTIGGIVSTATAGPRRLLRGGPRDLVIGAALVRADGVVSRSGGKVVKNVAGYDLARLLCGAYGTLGLVVEVAFRLHPRSQARSWLHCLAGHPDDAYRITRAVLDSQVVPSALEVERTARGWELVTLLEGTPAGVQARAGRLSGLLGEGAVELERPPPGWGIFPGAADDVLIKLTSSLPGVPRVLAGVEGLTAAAEVRGSAGSGVLHAAVPGGTAAADLAEILRRLRRVTAAHGGSAVVLRAPAGLRDAVDIWGPVPGLDLMRRLKREFDPQARMSPGRFVGGI